MHARRQKSLPKGILFDQAFDELRANAEKIQKRVSFDRRSVSEYTPALRALGFEEVQTLFFLLQNVVSETAIGAEFVTAGLLLFRQHVFKRSGCSAFSGMCHEANDRSAMDRRKVAIEHLEAVTLQQRLDRLDVVVQQMLVIDLVERQVLHDLLHIQKLHDEDSIVLQALANAFGDRMQFFEMEENSSRVNDIEFSIQRLLEL